VTGWTTSSDFPQVKGFQLSSAGGKDVFIAKLNASGTLVFSSFYGGSGQDSGNAIAVDSSGRIFVAGDTDSANLPVKDAIRSSLCGSSDAFLLELDTTGLILFATYLGGRYSDRATAVAVDGSGAVYLTGSTASPDFPAANSFQSTLRGAQNAFITKIDTRTKQILFSGFLGGSGGNGIASSDMGTAIAVDAGGAVYVAGNTNSTDFPVLNCFQCSASAFGDAFIAKIDPSGSSLLYSTYLGGCSADYATSIAVDSAGRAWVAGYTLSLDFPRDVFDLSTYHGQLDVFLTSLSPDGKSLFSSTLFGSSGADAAFAIAVSGANTYIAGQTGSNDLNPSGGIQNTFSGVTDGFIAFTTSTSTSRGLRFVPVTPCRVADTRTPDGPFGGPMLSPPAAGPDFSRDFVVPNSSCGIPVNAQAYALNVTVVPQSPKGLGFLTVWPAGLPRPTASTINSDGRVKAVSAIVPPGAASAIRIFVTDPTHVILDITGYFVSATDPTGLTFYPLAPCRVADSRVAGGPLAAGSTRDFPVLASSCSIPSGAVAYSLNLTALPSGKLGYLTAWPSGQPRPGVSALNAPTGTPTANASILPAGAGGSISVYVTDTTDLIIDINGYFAPAASGGLSLNTFGPCRVLESRPPVGTGAFSGTIDVSFPASACAVPSAPAYLVNATVIPPGHFSYLTLWPSGTPQPGVSTLNAYDGAITSNMAIVPASNGSISAYARDPTNLVIDVFGYFAP